MHGLRSGIGKLGELGPVQLLPVRGLLPAFYSSVDREGDRYTNPFSLWQAVDFLARSFARGMARHWTCSDTRFWWWLR